MPITVATNLDYLIEDLRLHLGDTDPTAYRYLDEWLRTTLVSAVKALQKRWSSRYLIDPVTYNVYRNIECIDFDFLEPPIIQAQDEHTIVLQASILIKDGIMQNNAWTFGSWRDAELSYSNIEGSGQLEKSLNRDIEELNSILKPPQNRLAPARKATLPGYVNNIWENSEDKDYIK